jgi:hypothetical protein
MRNGKDGKNVFGTLFAAILWYLIFPSITIFVPVICVISNAECVMPIIVDQFRMILFTVNGHTVVLIQRGQDFLMD